MGFEVRALLAKVRAWLRQNNAVIMAAIFGYLWVSSLLKGIADVLSTTSS